MPWLVFCGVIISRYAPCAQGTTLVKLTLVINGEERVSEASGLNKKAARAEASEKMLHQCMPGLSLSGFKGWAGMGSHHHQFAWCKHHQCMPGLSLAGFEGRAGVGSHHHQFAWCRHWIGCAAVCVCICLCSILGFSSSVALSMCGSFAAVESASDWQILSSSLPCISSHCCGIAFGPKTTSLNHLEV